MADTKNIRFVDNLCPYYKRLFLECGKYKKEGKLNSYWTFNGKIFVKKDDNDSFGIPMFHIDELEGYIDNDEEFYSDDD